MVVRVVRLVVVRVVRLVVVTEVMVVGTVVTVVRVTIGFRGDGVAWGEVVKGKMWEFLNPAKTL